MKFYVVEKTDPENEKRVILEYSPQKVYNCLTQFKVLERFYYERGGNKIVPPKIASKVLSKGGFKTGRCAFKEGAYNQATKLFSQSFRQHPNLKSLIYWTKAEIAKRITSS